MKYLASISLFLGVYETLFVFGLGCVIATVYTFATNKKYKEKHSDLFEGATTKSKERKILRKREIPLMVGLTPATIIILINQIL